MLTNLHSIVLQFHKTLSVRDFRQTDPDRWKTHTDKVCENAVKSLAPCISLYTGGDLRAEVLPQVDAYTAIHSLQSLPPG